MSEASDGTQDIVKKLEMEVCRISVVGQSMIRSFRFNL